MCAGICELEIEMLGTPCVWVSHMQKRKCNNIICVEATHDFFFCTFPDFIACVPCKPRMVDCTVVHQLHHSGQMTFEVCLRRHCHTQEIMFWGEKRRYCFASHIFGTNDCAIYYLQDCAIFRPFNIVVCTLRIDGTCTSEMGMSLCHPLFG